MIKNASTILIYEEKMSSHRWWDDYFVVMEIDGKLIGFETARTTGDLTPDEVGWEFDTDTICEVIKEEKLVYIYKPKK